METVRIFKPEHTKERIKGFCMDYRWLSNFWPCEVYYEGLMYRSSEAAYQAAKTKDGKIRMKFTKLAANTAKQKSKTINKRADWNEIAMKVMFDVCWDKFNRNPELAAKLIETGDRYLEETNSWNDTFWGVCNGKGSNHLGSILMVIREKLQNKKDNLK